MVNDIHLYMSGAMIASLELECKEMEETIMNLNTLQEEIRDETNSLKV